MEGVLALVSIVGFLIFIGYLGEIHGTNATQSQIIKECDKFGSFRAKEKEYSCTLTKE